MNWERWGRAAGVAFVVLTVASFIVGGEPPKVSDPAADVVSYFDGDRGQVLLSSFLFAVALGFWIWFGGTLANSLRERGEGRVAATIIGAVSAFVAVQLVAAAVNGMLAHSVARAGEDGVVQALFSLTWGLDIVAAIPSAVFFLAASLGLRRTLMIPAWLSAAGIGVAALFVLRSTNWARDGFWSPTGEYLFILIPLALLWILVTSVLLMRRTAEPIAGEPLRAPTT
ncbi:MAG: hypothetical protein LC777_18020 [Actinobacteria bacterium]|nr:hypothetical protein [Actinomycetota bacterium]